VHLAEELIREGLNVAEQVVTREPGSLAHERKREHAVNRREATRAGVEREDAAAE
jgi:hypothetical protein